MAISDLFTRPYRDLEDMQARISPAITFATERTAARTVPADLAAELTFSRATLDDLAAITRSAARHRAFHAEYGIETIKGLWFAFGEHAGLLGLKLA